METYGFDRGIFWYIRTGGKTYCILTAFSVCTFPSSTILIT